MSDIGLSLLFQSQIQFILCNLIEMAVQPKYILNDLENDIFATVVSFYGKIYLNLLLWQQIFLRTSLHICIFFKTFDQCDM